ncbi:MAG: PAS domain S-box protein [Alphaproteobacteria bacterium]|nr:PAS domain S-box protein [Alphaproteobacteria bacterium]
MGVRYRARSLRWRLGWLVLGCVLPLLALLAAEQYLQYSNNVGVVGQETLTLARGMSASVDLALEAHVQMLQALATSQALREGDLDGFRRRADELISEQGAVESILVLRPDGQMVMNTRVPAGAPLPVRSDLMSLRKAVQSGRAQISDLFNGTRSGRELVAVDIPIKDATGKILYILSMNPRLEAFADVIADQNLPRTWVAGIIDRRGLTVARLPNGDKEVGRPVSPGMLSSLDMPEGIVDTTSRDGVPVLAAFAHGPKHGWAVAIGVPRNELTGPFVRQALGTLAVGAFVLMGSLLFAAFAARRIANPILALRDFATGSTDAALGPLDATGIREIDDVASLLHEEAIELQHSAQQIRASEDRVRRIIEAGPTATLVVDAAGRIKLVNAPAEKLFGYSRAELLEQPVEMLVPERQRDYHPNLRRGFLADPQPRPMGAGRDLYGIHKDGSEIPLEIALTPVETNDGLFVVAAIVDISARKEAEEHLLHARRQLEDTIAGLQESELQLRRAQHIAHTGSFIWDLRSHQMRWSDETYEILGIARDYVPTTNNFDHLVHPDDVEAARQAREEAGNGVAPPPMEYRITRPDGGVRVLYREMEVHRDEADRPVSVIGIIHDITEWRRTEDQFRRIFDDNPIGMVLATADDYRFVRVNAAFCRLLGYTAEELIGRHRDEFAVAEDVGYPLIDDPASTTTTWQPRDKRYRTKSGQIVRARVLVMRLGEVASGEQVVLGIADDVSEYRRVEDQLRQAQKMEAIGNLTGGMAHDFNNLLGIIIGNLDIARRRVRDDDELLASTIAEAQEAAWRGADLTRRLLAFARRQPLRPVLLRVNELISDLVRLLHRVLGENIEITLHLAREIWEVEADPAQLEASLTNLATNSRDAMPRGGRLIIRTENRYLDEDYAADHQDVVPGEFVMVEVSDTGAGRSQEVISQAFDPFFTTKEPGKGTGLGLSMVFGFLKQSGGHVSVYSEEGVGTTFRLYLPRASAAKAAAPVVPPQTALTGGGEAILVVEDNAGMRRVVVQQLREMNYRVLECDRAAAALDILQREDVDLLFTDIVMPGDIDGIELAKLVMERWPGVQVVLTSGFPEVRVMGDGEPPPGVRLLSKPYRREELAAACRAALDQTVADTGGRG